MSWVDWPEDEAKPQEEKVTQTSKGLTSWQVMSSLFKPEIKPNTEEIAGINSFFLCSYLSNNKHSMPIASALNLWYNIPVPVQYRFAKDYSDMVGMAKKIKIISFSKKKLPEEMVKIIDNISKIYNINNQTAMEYFNLMSDDERNKMYNFYEHGIQKG